MSTILRPTALILVVATLFLAPQRAAAEEACLPDGELPARLIVVRLSRDAFSSLAEREIARSLPVSDVILDTPVRGLAQIRGSTDVLLVEDPERAGFQMVFTGTVHSRTVGANGPVTIYSRSRTEFRATKRVAFVPGEGFRAEPATVEADTQTVTEDIRANRGGIAGRIIRRKAWQRVAQTRSLTTQIAREKTSRRIAAMFDERLNARLAELNRRLATRQVFALVRGQGADPAISCCTKRDCVQICLGSQPWSSAAIDLPPLLAAAAPMQIWVHESLVGGEWARPLLTLVQAGQGVDQLLALSRALLPQDSSAAAPLANQIAPPPLAVESCGDWIVVQIGDPPPALAARDRREY